MAQVLISRKNNGGKGKNRKRPPRRRRHPKMVIRTQGRDGIRLRVPYAPKAVENAGLAPTYTEAARPGRMPLLLRSQDPVHTVSFDLFLGSPDAQEPVEQELATLRAIARSDDHVILKFGPSEGGLWRVTSFGWASIERKHGTNAITRATASLTLTRASDPAVGSGPVKGGAKGGKGRKGKDDDAPTKKRGDGKRRHYVVKRGDTLMSIAYKFYRDTSEWRKIADANNIRRPRNIKVGKRLVIP